MLAKLDLSEHCDETHSEARGTLDLMFYRLQYASLFSHSYCLGIEPKHRVVRIIVLVDSQHLVFLLTVTMNKF